MPRTAEQNQRLKEERRRALLKAAREVFARRGLAATKMTDLAAAAGISYGLVYHYFPDKESVFAALVEEAVRGGIELLASARRRPGTPWEQLHYVCTRLLEGIREEPSIPLILVQAHASESVPAVVEQALDRYSTQFNRHLEELIASGQKAGQIVNVPATELARTFLATVQGLALTQIFPQLRKTPFPSTDTILRLFKP
ncbi:TetR/AcrR family transcriptional regulator [Archangium violaceum]|uniref:TetR/AcrR family transcriptional regulator n=1 Tax=Archangium violaceum TaxID=83451 RepID=UPI002B31D8E9|nr:TetR/AcrR family transcriptional regulator [Archangium violaceum]